MLNEHHPIQLEELRVAELFIKISDPKKAQEELELSFSFGVGHSRFDRENSSILVGVKGVVGGLSNNLDERDPTSPFHLKVHLFGYFKVDITKFPEDKVEHWAANNAPLILFPFLREHVYGLASRAGIRQVIVPLYTVPTFKVVSPVSSIE